MKIRKTFKFEMAHIVRNAWSQRCSKNIHGHSYLMELFLTGCSPDKGQMLLDFGLIKYWINDFVDSFDHSLTLWNIEEDSEIITMACKNFERVIITPFSSSAEMQAKLFANVINNLVKYYQANEEANGCNFSTQVSNVKIHETTTGVADYSLDESDLFPPVLYPVKIFSPAMMEEVLNNKNYIWISEGIAQSWKSDEWVSAYNNFIM